MNWLVTNKEFVIMIVTSLGIAVILDNVFNRLVRQVVTKRVVY